MKRRLLEGNHVRRRRLFSIALVSMAEIIAANILTSHLLVRMCKGMGTQLHLNSLCKKEVEHETAGQTGSSWKASWKY